MKYLLTFVLTAFFVNPAFAVIVYVTDVDSQTAYIMDTDTGTFTTHDTAPVGQPGAIAVTDRIVLHNWPHTGGAEFDLGFNATGPVYSGDGSFEEMLDGTTDGQGTNYATGWDSLGVIVFDENFENGSVLFDPGFPVIGITYDTSDDTLWLANDDDGTVHQYSLGGSFIGSFDPVLGGRTCCLAYNPDDDTIWMGINDEGPNLFQFSTAGALLDTVAFDGWTPQNQFGADIQKQVIAAGLEPVPAGNALGGLLLTLLLLGGGMFALRIRSTA